MGTDELAAAAEAAERFLDNIETVVHGKREQITLITAALMCGGHVLLEDVPGTAKTVLARAIAQSIRGVTPFSLHRRHPPAQKPPAKKVRSECRNAFG